MFNLKKKRKKKMKTRSNEPMDCCIQDKGQVLVSGIIERLKSPNNGVPFLGAAFDIRLPRQNSPNYIIIINIENI